MRLLNLSKNDTIPKIREYLLAHLTLIRRLIVVSMGLTAFFVTKDNPLLHWSWIIYICLIVVYFLAEHAQEKLDVMPPLDKVRKYLLDFSGWEETSENTWHYRNHPEFIICPTEEDVWEVEAGENWVRAAINPRAFVRPMQIKYSETVLVKIDCIYFDEMRYLVPAPILTSISERSDLWFFSISKEQQEFIFLQFLLRKDEDSIFREPALKSRGLIIPVAIFKSNKEKEEFLAWLRVNPVHVEDRHNLLIVCKEPLITEKDKEIIAYSRAVIEALGEYRQRISA